MYGNGIDSVYLMATLIDIYEEELESGLTDSNSLEQALEVGWTSLFDDRGLTQSRQSMEVSLTTLRAGTTHATASQQAPSHLEEFSGKLYLPDQNILTYALNTEGGKGGSQNPQRFATISKATQMQM